MYVTLVLQLTYVNPECERWARTEVPDVMWRAVRRLTLAGVLGLFEYNPTFRPDNPVPHVSSHPNNPQAARQREFAHRRSLECNHDHRAVAEQSAEGGG